MISLDSEKSHRCAKVIMTLPSEKSSIQSSLSHGHDLVIVKAAKTGFKVGLAFVLHLREGGKT